MEKIKALVSCRPELERYEHFPGQICRIAKGFVVKKVAEAADNLAEQKRWREPVEQSCKL